MNIPTIIAVPIRAVFFTIALLCFGIYLAVGTIAHAVAWWWEQVRG